MMIVAIYVGWFGGDGSVKASGLKLTGLFGSRVEQAADGIRVIDGDTINIRGERIRISGLDTPETGSRAECNYERNLAARATERARELFAAARNVEIQRHGTDRYGRTLARVRIDGQSYTNIMVRERLAVRWAGRQHDWCNRPL